MSDDKPDSAQRLSAWHRTDLVSLFFGVMFLGVVGWWAAAYYLNWSVDWSWNVPNMGWFVAGALILLGLLGLLASARPRRNRMQTQQLPMDAPQAGWTVAPPTHGFTQPEAAPTHGYTPPDPTAPTLGYTPPDPTAPTLGFGQPDPTAPYRASRPDEQEPPTTDEPGADHPE
jgi:hypothetical protein